MRYPSGTAGQGAGVIIDVFGVVGQNPPNRSGGTTAPEGDWHGTNPNDPIVPRHDLHPRGALGQPVAHAPAQRIGRGAPERARGVIWPGNAVGHAYLIAAYNIADEWMAYSYATPPPPTGMMGMINAGAQSYSRLGEHNDYSRPLSGTYGTLATLAKFNGGISIYPNPASGTATVELKDVKVGSIVVLNNLGQRIVAQPQQHAAANQTVSLDISGLKEGLYFVHFVSADGQTSIYKELVVK